MKSILFSCVLFIAFTATAQRASDWCSQTKIQHFGKKPIATSKSLANMNDYDVKYVKLDVEMAPTNTSISGNVFSKALVTAPSLSLYVFELSTALTVDSVLINGQKLPFTIVNDTREVALTNALTQNTLFTAQVFYHGNSGTGGGTSLGAGIISSTSPTWGNAVSYTMSESYGAYLWWPCKQSLHDKIDSSDVWITIPSTCKAGSNGLLQNISTMPNNKVRYEWKNNNLIVNYLISISVSQYVDYSFYAHPIGMTDSILVQNYVYDNPNTLPFFKSNIDLTAQMIEYFSTIYGMYPFANQKYGHCMAPLGGGMEHQTMTTIGSFGNLPIIAHELGHQWFGDHVTCGTWKDIWVNEGFAAYSEQLYLAHFDGAVAARQDMDNVHNSVLSSPNGSVYVDDTTNENRIFSSRLTYDKGSAIVHSLRYEMNNDSLFFLTLRTFQNQYANHVATGLEFKQVAENISGLNLTDFFNQWYFGEGYPTFSASWNQDNDKVAIHVTQTASASAITPLFKTHLDIKLQSGIQDTIVRVFLNSASDTFYCSYSKTINIINGVSFDPNQWILNANGAVTYNPDLSTQDPNATGIKNIITSTVNQLTVYPNPAITELHIKLSSKNLQKVVLRNILGKVVLQSNQSTISVANLPASVYLLEAVDVNGKKWMKRVVKE
jgi:aminopeptidase N